MSDSLLCCMALLLFAVLLHRRSADMSFIGWPCLADVAACAVAGWLYALMLCISGRPLLALVFCILLLTGLYCVNAAKIRALRGEPLVFADVALAWQVVRFPALYLPFLPCKALASGVLVGIAGLTLLWLMPEPVAFSAWWLLLLCWPLFLLLLCSPYGQAVAHYLQTRWPLTFKAQDDARRYGPLGAALLHVCWHLGLREHTSTNASVSVHANTALPRSTPLPNIFLVQAESFCDPRIFSPHIPRDFLPHYDAACAQGISGSIAVAAFGAYTMRTEFAVLTGQSAASMGTDAFHPYWSAARPCTWSLARHLRNRGYRTVCLHPFYREFFFRHKAIPDLGFDAFISLENFPHRATFGPYVSDASVARSMLELLQDDRPVFCFAITMESHGPWRAGRLHGQGLHLPGLDAEAGRYLRHLRNADAMIGCLCAGLREQNRPGILGWYGDHLPNLPHLIPAGETAVPFFVWKTSRKYQEYCEKIQPETLGEKLLTIHSH